MRWRCDLGDGGVAGAGPVPGRGVEVGVVAGQEVAWRSLNVADRHPLPGPPGGGADPDVEREVGLRGGPEREQAAVRVRAGDGPEMLRGGSDGGAEGGAVGVGLERHHGGSVTAPGGTRSVYVETVAAPPRRGLVGQLADRLRR